MNNIKPSVKVIANMGAGALGWAGFKHSLMRLLGIPESEFDSWNVPAEWIEVYKKHNNKAFR